MKIIITAAGFGNRFVNKGINIPKYLIKVKGKTLLEYSLSTLSNFYSEEFIFIFRELKDYFHINKIIKKCINEKGESISKFKIINIQTITSGQAETVLNAQNFFKKDNSILIFNIDTCIKKSNLHILKADFDNSIDGLIYTTHAKGEHWSFAKTVEGSNKVSDVSEKKRISNNASIGLYYFKSFKEFKEIINQHGKDIIKKYKELYIMPIYQYLIQKNRTIVIKNIPFSDFIPLGTPDEISLFDSGFVSENKNV